MELWIRSQDKTQLIKVNNVYLDNEFVDIFYICENGISLGKYKTKERALEILDEIQELDIEHNPNIKTNGYGYSVFRIIYEMPKE